MFDVQVVEYLSTGGPPAWYKAKQRERAQRERQEARRRRRRVVVVGAGPAGLTAALHLKVGRGQGSLGCAGCASRDGCMGGKCADLCTTHWLYASMDVSHQWMFHQAGHRNALAMPGCELEAAAPSERCPCLPRSCRSATVPR